MTISRAMLLYGTEQPAPPPRVLRAGPLTAELEAGNLRYIRFGGAEMIRAISFLVRSSAWATFAPEIADLAIAEAAGHFRVTYRATIRDGEAALHYDASIEGRADGSLRFAAVAVPETDFVTCRTGFVVLHPIAGVAGMPAEIEHADGAIEHGRFPALIDPVQPMLNLRALTHGFAPGARVTCRMEGDVFEMEDQRNWTDASYKTYSRPLALPWPYTLAQGKGLSQSVTLTVHGSGGQTRAFIHIRDPVRCIEIALNNPPERGEQVSVFNQVTETYRVQELAELVSKLTGVEIAHLPNPRKEAAENDLNVTRDRFLALGLDPTTLSDGLLEETREIGAKYASRADFSKIVAKTVWKAGMEVAPDLMR